MKDEIGQRIATALEVLVALAKVQEERATKWQAMLDTALAPLEELVPQMAGEFKRQLDHAEQQRARWAAEDAARAANPVEAHGVSTFDLGGEG